MTQQVDLGSGGGELGSVVVVGLLSRSAAGASFRFSVTSQFFSFGCSLIK